jgi:cytidyltransferase-like protein
MTRIYTDVMADLFHWGHVNLFRQLRTLGDYLIVGVNSDESRSIAAASTLRSIDTGSNEPIKTNA